MQLEEKCFYVAPDGSDTWSGLCEKPSPHNDGGPFATLRKAVEAARSCAYPGRKKIILRGGSYFEAATEFTAEDSGLSIEAYAEECPRLYGGKRITGWQKEKNSPFMYAELPEVKNGHWDFRLLTVNGGLRKRSRLPANGTFQHLTRFDVDWLSTSAGGWARKPTMEELTTLQYKEGDLGPWLDINNAELTVFHRWDESMVGIKAHDEKNHVFVFSNPCGHPPGSFNAYNYVVWNTREGLTEPGQWYLDRTAGRLVYWPFPGEDMEKAEVIAPTHMHILHFTEKAEGITIKGLELAVTNTPLMAADFGAVLMPGAVHSDQALCNCVFEELKISSTGGHGMKFIGDSRDVVIKACEISFTGAGGILFRNPSQGEMPSETADDRRQSKIFNNFIHHIGTVSPSAIAINTGCSEIVHNEITDVPYSGICCGGFDINRYAGKAARIECNLISRAMQVLHDGAAIYATLNKNGIMRGNVVKDILQPIEEKTIKCGLYLDELAEGWVMEENLTINCSNGTLNHMASRNIIRNNLFFCDTSLKINLIRCKHYTVERNIFFSRDQIVFEGNPDAIEHFNNNLVYSVVGRYEYRYLNDSYMHYATEPLSMRDGSEMADPLLIKDDENPFMLSHNSLALSLGIKAPEWGRAGRINQNLK